MIITKKRIICYMCVLILLIGIVVFGIKYVNIERVEEIVPAEEISKTDEIKTVIYGYYYDKLKDDIVRKEILINQDKIREDMYKNILLTIFMEDSDENIVSANEIFSLNIDNIQNEDSSLCVYFNNPINEFENIDEKDRENLMQIIVRTLREINGIDNVRFYFNNIEFVPSV